MADPPPRVGGIGLFLMGMVLLTDGLKGFAGDALRRWLVRFTGTPAKAFASGALVTALVQSSSATTVTVIGFVSAGLLTFPQAASLVIGAAVGTTVTGALAAIGGSVPAKRTALAQVSFNLATGLIAIVLLPVFLWGIGLAQKHAGLEAGAMSLAAFHTLFIAVGVAIFLPFVHRFSRAIERVLPDHGPALTRHLDDTVLQTPEVALEATRRALRETAAETFRTLRGALGGPGNGTAPPESQLRQALDRLQKFFPKIPPAAEDEPLSQSRVTQMHAMDHLTRLQTRLAPPSSVRRVLDEAHLEAALKLARAILERGEVGLRGGAPEGWLPQVEQQASALVELRRQQRPEILQHTAGGASAPARALDLLDAMRWLDRPGYHTWRICHYLAPEDNSILALTDLSDHPDD